MCFFLWCMESLFQRKHNQLSKEEYQEIWDNKKKLRHELHIFWIVKRILIVINRYFFVRFRSIE
jgi:hypothetical protein